MASEFVDLYELLQISRSAEPETIRRVYRLLARRWHPDNARTGDALQFRAIHEAHLLLTDPVRRAEYDGAYEEHRRARSPVAVKKPRLPTSFAAEHEFRRRVLETLYLHRRASATKPGMFLLDLEETVGGQRDDLEFTIWYLQQKALVQKTDNSCLAITADGVDFLDDNAQENGHRRRLGSAHAAA
jgi:curved DNA-binding protein